MALEIGGCKATIHGHKLETIAEKTVIVLECQTEHGDEARILIFVTEKSAGIARAQLKIAGFDPDSDDLERLDAERELLAGNTIPIYVDEYNGKLRAQIDLQRKPDEVQLSHATRLLRSAKKKGEGAVPPLKPGRTGKALPLKDEPPPHDDSDDLPF